MDVDGVGVDEPRLGVGQVDDGDHDPIAAQSERVVGRPVRGRLISSQSHNKRTANVQVGGGGPAAATVRKEKKTSITKE